MMACLLVAFMIVIPVYAGGYATNIVYLDCACKWGKSQIVVWIENSQEEKYTNHVIDAFHAWQTNFPKLKYLIYTDKPERWDIHVKIVEKHFLESKEGTVLATSNINADYSNASIESVYIVIPTSLAEGNDSEHMKFNKMNDNMFYNIILHEVGHAIGLGHANENEQGMIDPMYKYIDSDEEKRSVSKLDVMTLQRLYR